MRRLPKEDRAGLYITIIVHLVVLIVLLAGSLGRELGRESSFVLDFTKAEEAEKLKKEVEFKEEISRKLEKMLGDAGNTPVRNVSVDRGALKDDRGTNADELYKDAERLSKELDKGYSVNGRSDEVSLGNGKKEESEKRSTNYSGPSVLSWELEGRKASRLPIPAYRCMGAGEVKVLIDVNPQGTVIGATIDETLSSKDGCLRDFAVRAARVSKFSASGSAPAKQRGYIIYQFIAQ